MRLSAHPRAQRQIRRLRSWGGLAGFGLAAYAASQGGAPFLDTVLRALVFGVASYLVVWLCAQQVWRQLAIGEVRAAERAWLERRAAVSRALDEDQAEVTGGG